MLILYYIPDIRLYEQVELLSLYKQWNYQNQGYVVYLKMLYVVSKVYMYNGMNFSIDAFPQKISMLACRPIWSIAVSKKPDTLQITGKGSITDPI